MPTRAKTYTEHMRDGSFRPHRHADMAAAAGRPIVPPTRPKGLTGPAAKLWDRLVAELAGIVTETDSLSLTLLVRWTVEAERVEKAMRAAEPGTIEHVRLSRAFAAATAHLGPLYTRFGLDPVSRERLPAPGEQPPGETEVAPLPAVVLKPFWAPKEESP